MDSQGGGSGRPRPTLQLRRPRGRLVGPGYILLLLGGVLLWGIGAGAAGPPASRPRFSTAALPVPAPATPAARRTAPSLAATAPVRVAATRAIPAAPVRQPAALALAPPVAPPDQPTVDTAPAIIDAVTFDPARFTCTILATAAEGISCGLTFDKNTAPNPCTFDPAQSYAWSKTRTRTQLYIRRFQCLTPALARTNAPFKAALTAPHHQTGQPYFYAVGHSSSGGRACCALRQDGTFTAVIQTSILSSTAPQDYYIGNKGKAQVMLTFDAHDTPFTTDARMTAVLNILKQKHVHATFFVTGQWAYLHGDLLRRMIRDGHTVGNHTADHTSLRALVNNKGPLKAQQAIEDELLVGDRMIRDQGGPATRPYFRAPSVDYNRTVLQIAANLGYSHINYTLDPGDWKAPYPRAFGPISQAAVWRNIFQSGKLQPGAILLQHVDNAITPAILAAEIDGIRARGYTIVPLAEGLQ